MTIRQAYYLNWFTDILLTIVFSPFIIVFFGFGYVVKLYNHIRFYFGKRFLKRVTNITYDTEEQMEEVVNHYSAREIYVLIKDHLEEKQKAYQKTLNSVDKILNGTE